MFQIFETNIKIQVEFISLYKHQTERLTLLVRQEEAIEVYHFAFHSISLITKNMSTFYFEEILDDDDVVDDFDDVDGHGCGKSNVNVDATTKCTRIDTDTRTKRMDIKGMTFKPCPQPIGGGSSLTLMNRKDDENHNKDDDEVIMMTNTFSTRSTCTSTSLSCSKVYVFGGCGRSGVPSSSLHCFDVGKLVSE